MTWADTTPSLIALYCGLAALLIWSIGLEVLKGLRRRPSFLFSGHSRVAQTRRGWKVHFIHLPTWLRFIALALLMVGLARPQKIEAETAEVEGIDIVVAFDMSGSMAYLDYTREQIVEAQNAQIPLRDRFTDGVEVLRNFIKTRKYDRVSLVVFGKEAFLQFPLTLDYGVMLNILDRMKLEDIDGQGTVIGDALGKSIARLRTSDTKTKLVILITDGEDNGSKVSPVEMAKTAAENSVPVFPILVGKEGETMAPMRDQRGQLVDVRPIRDNVNPQLLKEIAEITKGRFYRATDRKQLEKDLHEILDTFEKTRLVDLAAADRTDLFYLFVWAGLALLMIELLLGQTWLRRFP
ncbi:MAG: vWA domain-containing protein [Bradymonadia bacterium]